MSIVSTNIIHAGIPSRSALRVATLRAVHQLLDEPIVFDDPIALPILGDQLEATVRGDPFQFNDPLSRGLRAALIARSRFAEEMLHAAISKGVQQYVVLGAGLDTFAYRNPFAADALQVYEVDHPSTQAWKKSLLQEGGIPIPQSVKFAACDFERSTLNEILREAGFNASEPACFSWLGVTMYLTQEAVFETLRLVAALPQGSSITFDYRTHPALQHPIERVIGEFLEAQFLKQGEPWISSYDPAVLAEEARKLGFQSADNIGAAELNSRYFARRKDGLQVGGGFRLMYART
ncbi:MAG: class I SAM-dependent methyltransferase [Burkholderiales bacterium]|nr:class I SAM-dependent methyltransferase [Burkholderiales bacterium]